MAVRESITDPVLPQVTVDNVKRILEVGRLLSSVLTPEELQLIQSWYLGYAKGSFPTEQPLLIGEELGNTGVT